MIAGKIYFKTNMQRSFHMLCAAS